LGTKRLEVILDASIAAVKTSKHRCPLFTESAS
jgi:hypothetical protein